MNLLSSLLAYTARQIAALRSADTVTNGRIDTTNEAATALTNRVSTAESNITTINGRLDTAISAVTTDTEVTDIRVGDDGVTYGTAGTAVRAQFSNLKSEISDIAQVDNLVYYKTFDGEVNTDSDGYYSYSDGSYYKYAEGATKTFITTEKFNVLPRSIISITSNIPADQMIMLTWDENDNFIGTINTANGVIGNLAYRMAINYKVAYEAQSVEYKLDAPPKYTCAGDLCEALIPCIEPATFEDLEITFPTTGYFINKLGQLTAMDGCNVSDFVKIPANQYNRFIRITGYKFFNAVICVFYDKYKHVIGYFPDTEDSTKVVQGEIVQIPFDAKYIRFGDCSSKTTAINATIAEEATTFKPASSGETPSKRLYGKKWLVIGDSWVSPYTLGQDVKIFADYVTDNLGCTLINKGVGGTGYWKDHTDNLAYYQRVPTFTETADIVSVFGSLNDLGIEDGVYGSQVLGTYTDNTTSTVGGCINATLDAIEAKYPNAYITVLTPPPWNNSHDNNYPEQYVNLIKQICDYRSIPCLDLFHCSTLRPWDATFLSTYYLNGGHANTLGHKRFSGLVQKFIEAVYYVEEE